MKNVFFIYIILLKNIFSRKCRGLNIGKSKNGHEVIFNGQLSPEFNVLAPFYHHKTYDVGKEDTDYFYLSSPDYKIKVNSVEIETEVNTLLHTVYRIDE